MRDQCHSVSSITARHSRHVLDVDRLRCRRPKLLRQSSKTKLTAPGRRALISEPETDMDLVRRSRQRRPGWMTKSIKRIFTGEVGDGNSFLDGVCVYEIC